MATARTLNLTLTLLEDLVASEHPATEGGHESLDYIPGAMLLGAVAARIYCHCSRQEAYQLFHSRVVRFGDGIPLYDGLPCWPMPICWHYAKGEVPIKEDGFLDASKVRYLGPGSFAEGVQPKQLRTGFVRCDGMTFSPERSLRMKTAIDPTTGRAAESQLFGYQAILAGFSYAVRIESDPDLPDGLWNRVTDLFGKPCELMLGRSRSAEYGRVRVEAVQAGVTWPSTTPVSSQLTLWCLTDLALLDGRGQSTLQPTPAHFGLTCGRLDVSRTFLRFRRFAPWNAYRQAYDLQRQVIRRGSVIAFSDIDPPLTNDEVSKIAAGVGLCREQGLGRVCVDPRVLASEQPSFDPAIRDRLSAVAAPRPRDDALIAWLEAQRSGGNVRRDAEEQAKAQAKALKERYRLARAYAGVPVGLPVGPSPAQWGNVYEAARTATDRNTLRAALFDGADAICKETGENWKDQFRDDQGVRTFRDWLKGSALPGLATVQAVRLFGREAQRLSQGEQARGNREEKQA